jgi:hypothetical protein
MAEQANELKEIIEKIRKDFFKINESSYYLSIF